MTELELIEGCRREDNFFRRRLYDLYSQQMMGICFRYTGDKFLSQDLLHDGFIKVFQSVKNFNYRGEGSLKAWMSRIFVNVALDYLKKNDTLNHTVLLENGHDAEITVDEQEAKAIPDDILMRFVAELPTGYRMVFNLYTFEEMSHKEIANMLHINESSSRSQLYRAKTILAEKIKIYAKQYE